MLSKSDIDALRDEGLLYPNENAVLVGDKIFAENIETGDRRLIKSSNESLTVSEHKKLLMD